jgi:hypothetical protein
VGLIALFAGQSVLGDDERTLLRLYLYDCRDGGMNYPLPAPVPKKIIASILFYAIAAANQDWGIQEQVRD